MVSNDSNAVNVAAMANAEEDLTPEAHPVYRRVTNWTIVPRVVAGIVRNGLRDPAAFRGRLLKNVWTELRTFGAHNVRSVDVRQIRGLHNTRVDGGVSRFCPLLVTAIAKLLEAENIFEFGTYMGETAWMLAHNLPNARVYTLDLPDEESTRAAALELTDPEYFVVWDRGARFRSTPEGTRITQLYGDSARFDFAPFRETIDLAYIDASHSYSYVRADTEAALTMLTRTGTIIWDDYTYYAGIHAYLNELAPSLDRPIYHILGTRLALYSRWDIITKP